MPGKHGFASMDPKKQREIASQGGRASHAKGTAHEWTSEEAVEAGRKGGRARGKQPQGHFALRPDPVEQVDTPSAHREGPE